MPKEQIKHAYIPDIFGKEKRKDKRSKEGKLGVEGVSKELILEALRKCGASCEDSDSEFIEREKLQRRISLFMV